MGVLNFLKFATPGAALPKPVGGSVTYGQGESLGGSIVSAIADPISTPFDKPAYAMPLEYSEEQKAQFKKEDEEKEKANKQAQKEWEAEQTKKAKVPQVGSTTAGQQVAQQIQEALRRRLGL
jgi:hypothetical protein